MNSLLDVVSQIDIRRAQVLIEALIVEMSEGDGINLGVQWGSLETGAVVQYPNSGAPIGQVLVGLEGAKDETTIEQRYNATTQQYDSVPITNLVATILWLLRWAV